MNYIENIAPIKVENQTYPASKNLGGKWKGETLRFAPRYARFARFILSELVLSARVSVVLGRRAFVRVSADGGVVHDVVARFARMRGKPR